MEGEFFEVRINLNGNKTQTRTAIKPVYGKEYIVGRTFHAISGEDIKATYIGYDGQNYVFVRDNKDGKIERFTAETCLVNYLSDGEDDPSYPHDITTTSNSNPMKSNEIAYIISLLERLKPKK